MKRLLILICTIALFVCVVACSSTTYRDDVAAETLSHAALAALGDVDAYMDGTADYFAFYFEGNEGAELVTECKLMFHREETNVNELGVLRVASEQDAQDVAELASAYLSDQTDYLRSFAANYSPADMDKIDNADVMVLGNYVIYYILSPTDEQAVLDAVRAVLTPDA